MTKIVDLTNFFAECGLSANIQIQEEENMYPFDPNAKSNWVYFTLVGHQRLKEILDQEGRLPKVVACIAAGSGVEVIGMNLIFPDLNRLFFTDVDGVVVNGARYNLLKNWWQRPAGFIYTSLDGLFCEPLKIGNCFKKFDLIHGNVPNLVCSNDKDLSSGDDRGTFIEQNSLIHYDIPEKYLKWGLGANYAYLRGAKDSLAIGGSVVTVLGGRFPLGLVNDLFMDCGLTLMPEFSVGFKYQTQPEPNYVGYAELESKYGVEFDFFGFDEAVKLLEKEGINNPSFKHSGEEIKNLLGKYQVSAKRALKMHNLGKKCGHTVHMFRGLKEKD